MKDSLVQEGNEVAKSDNPSTYRDEFTAKAVLVCQDNIRMDFLKLLRNIFTIIHHQPLFFKIFCIK